jgi:hypothetical protein
MGELASGINVDSDDLYKKLSVLEEFCNACRLHESRGEKTSYEVLRYMLG